VLVLITLILLVFMIPVFYSRKYASNSFLPADTSWMAAIKRIEVQEQDNNKRSYRDRNDDSDRRDWQYDRFRKTYSSKENRSLFYFDPNTLTTEGWKKLGLRDKTIKTIQNYLSKGGHFRKPEDLSEIYGLFEDEYERLEPYIRIENQGTSPSAFSKNEKSLASLTQKKEHYPIVDINTADTSAFIALPGIGSKLAMRIINFREKLGGFYSINQVGETFGLPDSVFQTIRQYFKLENPVVRKININTATLDELKAHPYIRYNLANPIIAYRNQHGPFSKVEDIKAVMAVNNEIYNRIAPYLSTE
jgi:competence protein ComEA